MEQHLYPDTVGALALLRGAAHRRRGTIVVVDVVESVRLVEQDEASTVARWQSLVDGVVRTILPPTGGRLVKSLGDGMLLEFAEACAAVEAALAIQRAAGRANAGIDPGRRIRLRIGVHEGEHVVDALDVYGHSVNLAARLTTLARPDEIVASAEVRDRIAGRVGAEVEDLGECWLRHVSRPVRACRLGPRGAAPSGGLADAWYAPRARIAVMPLAARGPEPAHEALGEAIVDALIGALVRAGDVDVLSRLGTGALRGPELAPPALGERFGATHVLSGHYRVTGARIAVTAELCHARSSRVLWSDTLRSAIARVSWGGSVLTGHLAGAVRAALAVRAA